MSQFKPGDIVVPIRHKHFNVEPIRLLYKVSTNKDGDVLWEAEWAKYPGTGVFSLWESKMVLEAIYKTPLYNAMKENE